MGYGGKPNGRKGDVMIINDHGRGHLRILQLHLGGDRNFQYLLADARTGEAVAVDPGFAPSRMLAIAREQGLTIGQILITHGHSDHQGGAVELAALTGAVILAGDPGDLAGAEPLADDQLLRLGGLVVRALATPGHAPDHFCFMCQDCLLTGDLLFCGKVGGTGPYFPGSSAGQEWESLQRLLLLPPETRIYPGHDYYGGQGTMPFSTLAFEQEHNPFLTSGGFEAFCALKENWAEYKEEHGIR